MTDPREMLARLNPTNVRFDVGRGGGNPELTNIDIAGALGMVPAGLGREVLEACWWPDGAATRKHGLRDAVTALVGPEISRQTRRVLEASLDLQLAEAAILWSNKATSSDAHIEVGRCRERLGQIRKECWPKNAAEKLPLIARAVIEEIKGQRCASCKGTGLVGSGSKVLLCKACDGNGNAKILDAWRADAIKVDSSDFPKRWKRVYEWVFTNMRDAEAVANRQFGMALRREAA